MYSGNYDSGNGGIFIVAIIVLILGGWGISAAKCGGADHHSAEKEFKVWAKGLGLDYKGEVCNNHDSDGDGYVSCTYSLPDGSVHTVECAGSFNMQHGCRAPKPVLRSETTVINSSSSSSRRR